MRPRTGYETVTVTMTVNEAEATYRALRPLSASDGDVYGRAARKMRKAIDTMWLVEDAKRQVSKAS